MPQKEALRIFTAVGPEDRLSAALKPARIFYHFDRPFPAPPPVPGGIMVLAGDVRASRSQEIAAECRRCGYGGILCGYGSSSTLELLRLCEAMERRGLRVYLQEHAWRSGCNACVLLSSALSGGSLQKRIEEAQAAYGSIALDLERICRRFPLPCPDGTGFPLQSEEAKALQSRGSRPFFSEDLQCMAFHVTEGGKTSFVLYDTPETLQRKTLLARSLGVSSFFLLYPEWSEAEILDLQDALKERENPVILR